MTQQPAPPQPELPPPTDGATEDAYEVTLRDRPAWQNGLRAAVGLRPLPPLVTHRYRIPVPVDPDGPAALRRGLGWTLAALAFAAVATLGVWLYGAHARAVELNVSAQAGDVARQVVQSISRGDLVGARAMAQEASNRFGSNITMDYIEGYLQAGEAGLAATPPADLLQAAGTDAPEDLIRLAGYYAAVHDPAGALEAMHSALAAAPGSPGVGLLVAATAMDAGEPAETVEQTNRLQEMAGTNVTLCALRGAAYLALNDREAAIREFSTGLLLDTGSPRLHQGLAEAYNGLGRYTDALAEARAAARLDPASADARFLAGTAHDLSGDWNLAEEQYRQALRLDPRHSHTLNNLAYMLATRRNRVPEALGLARQALALAPTAPDVRDTAGWVYHLAGDNAKALPLLEGAAASQPDDDETKLHLAVTLTAVNRAAEARPLLERIAARTADSPARREARQRLATLSRARQQ
jgi:tetratricopeptide (TPR) repeat protein